MNSITKSSLLQRLAKRGFSDKLYFANLTFTWIFVIVCILMTVFQNWLGITDFTVVGVGIPAAFTELGIHTAVIVHKASKENISKFGGNDNECDKPAG